MHAITARTSTRPAAAVMARPGVRPACPGIVQRSRCVKINSAMTAHPTDFGEARITMPRRVFLITVPAAVMLWDAWHRADAAEEFRQFLGYNFQPDLYLGSTYGTSINHSPQYSFEYPAQWEEDEITKTEKSTMGMDGRVLDPKHPKQKAFVIALGGKDYKDARMVNLKQTMDAFAGGDADLRAAITDATDIQQAVKKVEGREVYMYDITSDRRRYLSTISQAKDGTMYALFVTATPSAFAKDEAQYRHIQNTFKLL